MSPGSDPGTLCESAKTTSATSGRIAGAFFALDFGILGGRSKYATKGQETYFEQKNSQSILHCYYMAKHTDQKAKKKIQTGVMSVRYHYVPSS